MFLISRSRSAFFTSSPFTRASTSGSCAGTGLAAGAAGGAVAGVAPPGAAGVVAPGFAAGAPDCAGAAADAVVDAAGALRQAAPLHVTTVMRMVDRTLIKTKTSTLSAR